MEKTKTEDVAMEALAPRSCDQCGGPMRLVGTEPHPVYAQTDLFTYACVACDAVQVTSVPLERPAA